MMRYFFIVGLLVATLLSTARAQPNIEGLTPERKAKLDEAYRAYDAGYKLWQNGKPKDALPLLERALQLSRDSVGEDGNETGVAHNALGSLLSQLHRFDDAIEQLKRAMAVREKIYGPLATETAEALANLGRTQLTAKKLADAAQSFDELLALAQKMDDPNRQFRLTALALGGDAARLQRKHAEALAKFSAGLRVLAENPQLDQHARASFLQFQGQTQHDMGDFNAAIQSFQQGIALHRQLGDREDVDIGYLLQPLARSLRRANRDTEARHALERMLALREHNVGPNHADTAFAHIELGNFLFSMGALREAQNHYERAVAIYESALGKQHGDTAMAYLYLGGALVERMDVAAGRAYYQKALEIQRQIYGDQHIDMIITLHSLGQAAYLEQDYATARKLQEQVLELARKEHGAQHPNVAQVLSNLGQTLEKLGQREKALRTYEEALAIQQAAVGPEHPQTAAAMAQVAYGLNSDGKADRAEQLLDDSRHIMRRYVGRLLPSLSDQEQLNFLTWVDGPKLSGALDFGLQHKDDAATAARSAEWLLNGKGVTSESLAQRALLSRGSGNPELAELARTLTSIRQRLADMSYVGEEQGEREQRAAELKRLQEQEQELARRLHELADLPEISTWAELSAVRQAIPAGNVLIDIARFDYFAAERAGQKATGTPYYAAWIVPPAGKGDVRIVELGEAEQIDKLVTQARQAIENPNKIRDAGEVQAEEEALAALVEVSQSVLRPILAKLPADTNKLTLSPDSNLWLLPWAAMPLADGRYAVEEYEIRYVTSGRELVSEKVAAVKSSLPVIVANPNFDMAPQDTVAATRAVLRGTTKATDLLATRSAGTEAAIPKVGALPGTAEEAKAIQPKLTSYAGSEPVIYSDRYALEGVFKALQSPKVLVVSTHGFFLGLQAQASRSSSDNDGLGRASGMESPTIENPLVRCGLLLAGCNKRGVAPQADDGVLTGLEIVGIDLRGTELVVLSACETGLGEVNNGQGVAGLRQAFQLAGAEAVAATLWQIPDRDTALLMTDFFDQLAKGENNAASLREAQLARITARRKQGGAAHPFFWAAFTLTGK